MKKKKGILSFALAIAIGLSVGPGMIPQKVYAAEDLESFAQAQTATETITPKQYENFKQYNEGDLTPTNSIKSALSMPKDGERDSLYLKINLPVRCRLDIYTKYIGDHNSSSEMYGSLYNANGVKQNTDKVLDSGLYYYAVSRTVNNYQNPYWKVYAYYLPVGEELTEDGQKYIAYGKGDRLNKVLSGDTVGKITYAPGPTTYKFVAKAPGAVYMEVFDEYGNGEIKYIDDAEFALYDSKMKLIAKQPNKTEDYKLINGSLNLHRGWEGVAFNVKKKGTYYLKMTNYTGSFAYHMRFAKGLTIKALLETSAYIFADSPSKIVKGCMSDKKAYNAGTNNLYINEPPLMAACITNLSYNKDRRTNIIKWGKVKTAQKYMIRRIYTYEKNKKTIRVQYKKKYTKKTYYKMTKKDMQGRKQIYVEIRPVRNGKFGPAIQLEKGSCVVVRNTKGKMTMSLISNWTPFF